MAELNIIGAKEENRYFPYQSAFRVTRESFWQAGQDSWTAAPAQNPDLFQSLMNVEPVLQGGLNRRRGYTLFNNNADEGYNHAYSYRNEIQNTRSLVWTSPLNVEALNEDGSSYLLSIFTPSLNAQAVRMVLSRDFGYFADGIRADYLKWDGTATATNLTNWGIDSTNVASGSVGPSGPTAAADQGTAGGATSEGPVQPSTLVSTGDFPVWTINGTTASSSFYGSHGDFTATLQATGFASNYAAAVPAGATITGIGVSVTRNASDLGGFADFHVNLIVGGSTIGSNNYANKSLNWPAITATANYGGSADSWGFSLTPADVNASNFGVSIIGFGGGSFIANVQSITLTVFFTVGSGDSWTNPTYIELNDGNSATATASSLNSSALRGYTFGFSSTGVIAGIQVDIKCSDSSGTATINPQLVQGGNAYGLTKTSTITSSSLDFITFGSSTDLWGGSWTPAQINDSSFGVQFFVNNTSQSSLVSVDYVQITVYSGAGPVTLGMPGSGNITLLSGRVYTIVPQNSLTGTTGNFIPFSISTGPLSSNDQPLSDIVVFNDPQVDTKLILATADGGDETTLYLLDTIPNSQTTYTDNTPDSLTASVTSGPSLLTNPVYQETDSSGFLHGVAFNYPPPLLSNPIVYNGSLWGYIGPTLYYSKALFDVTTSTGTITTKWEEAWPATNSFDVSTSAENVTGLYTDGQTLYVGTDHAVRIVSGSTATGFSQPVVLFNETGVINQDVWQTVFAEGQPVGAMWLTPDKRVIFSNYNNYQDVGTPIQDILNSININVAQTTAHACFVSGGPSEYYMLYIPTGTSTVANTVCVYNMRSQKWFIWTPTDTVLCSLFNINSQGVPQWLFSSGTGSLYYWDSTVNFDRNNNTPIMYPVPATTSWLDFGDMGLTKGLNKLIATTGDPALTVAIQGAIRVSDFASGGVKVIPTTTVQPEIFGDLFVPLVAAPGYFKWYQITFTSPASTVSSVLSAFDIEAQPSMRM